MSLTNQVADAVVTLLNGTVFTLPFTAARLYAPEWCVKAGDLDTLKVSVVPRPSESSLIARSLVQQDIRIDVCVQKKIELAEDEIDQTEADDLMDLAEAIDALLVDPPNRRLILEKGGTVGWIKSAKVPLADPGHLRQHNVFTAVIELTYRGVK